MRLPFWPGKPEPEHTLLDFDDETGKTYIANEVCDACGSKIYVMFTCHTWPSVEGRWMSCLDCDSAADLVCLNDDCTRPTYTWGLNPNNPRSIENEKHRPEWLLGDWPY